jgi:hypothetical protein
MSPSTTRMIPATNLERLGDFYAYVLDASPVTFWCPAGSSRATSFERSVLTTSVTLVETRGPRPRDLVVLDVVDDAAWEQLRRRLLCLAATDGVVRIHGETRSLSFRDPEGAALATLRPKGAARGRHDAVSA